MFDEGTGPVARPAAAGREAGDGPTPAQRLQMKLDAAAGIMGLFVALSLISPLVKKGYAHRTPEIIVWALWHFWMVLLPRYKQQFYLRNRWWLLTLHHCVQYGMGFRSSNIIRVMEVMRFETPMCFLLAFNMTNSTLWLPLVHGMLPQPFWAFVMLQPLPLLIVMQQQVTFCEDSLHKWDVAPVAFKQATAMLRSATSWGQFAPEWVFKRNLEEEPVQQCIKVQVWMVLVLGYVAPAVWMHRMQSQAQERQRRQQPRPARQAQEAEWEADTDSQALQDYGTPASAIWLLGIVVATYSWHVLDLMA